MSKSSKLIETPPKPQLGVETRIYNAAWGRSDFGPMSVVVPFFRYDVLPLAIRLAELVKRSGTVTPLIFVDDGSPDRSSFDALTAGVASCECPVLAVALGGNVGRSKVRNILCELASTEYLLYMDSDMWPDEEDFIERYLRWIAEGSVDVLYGGRSAKHATLTGPEYRLHRAMTAAREALPAQVRQGSPAFHFYSCNFLVRKEVLAQFPLDEEFRGWGWEDVEWAARVSKRFEIRHEDNPASHLGLLTADQILQKYAESIGNFTRVIALCPDMVRGSALFKVSRLIGLLRADGSIRAAAKWLAKCELAPVPVRIRALMFYKAALYARIAYEAGG